MNDSVESDVERGLDDLARHYSRTDYDGSVDRVVGEVIADRRRRTRRRNGVAFGAGVAAVAATVVVLNTTGVLAGNSDNEPTATERPAGPSLDAGRGPAPDNQDAFDLTPGDKKPCFRGQRLDTMQALRAATSTPVWAPKPGVVSGAVFKTGWNCAGIPLVRYGDFDVDYETGWRDTAVPKEWHRLADEWGGHVGTVLGRPAWIAPGDDHRTRERVPTPGNGIEYQTSSTQHAVQVVVGDISITATADATDTSIKQVIDLVNSLQIPTRLR